MSKIFVGNFSFSVDDDQLKEYFSKAGAVISAKVMKEGQGGRSRGFGFVEFSNPEDAQKAISEFDGSVWEGRVVKVSEDRSNRRSGGDYSSDRRSSDAGPVASSGARSSGGPTGYFRAQPLDLGYRRRKKVDPFMEDGSQGIDYKNPKVLARFMSERGRILPRRMTGLTASNQRQVSRAIKRSQHIGLLPYRR